MSRRAGWLLLVVPLLLAGSYAVRFALMEEASWVGVCAQQADVWQCQVRALLGWLIHFRVIAAAALLAAVLGFLLPRAAGWWLALAGLLLAVPALVLYSASLAVFAVVLAGLRLVRRS